MDNQKYIWVRYTGMRYKLKSSVSEYSVSQGPLTIKFDEFLEAVCIYQIYGFDDFSAISQTLKSGTSDVLPGDIVRFVSKFKADHPGEERGWGFENIEPLATEDQDLVGESMEIKGKFSLMREQSLPILNYS